MGGERQHRSRAHPVSGNPLASAAKSTTSALPPRPQSAPLAEEPQLLKASHAAGTDVRKSKHGQEKKRRWRPDLGIPTPAELYPTPTTYTNSQGTRVGVMPRQKASGESSLQKTAVLNSTMAQNMPTMRAEQTALESRGMISELENPYRTRFDMRSNSAPTGYAPMISDRSAQKCAPTPSDLLDYDALDHENAPWVPDNDDATENDMVYSDFSAIDPNTPVPDDNDFFDPHQGRDAEPLPPNDPDENTQGLTWPNEGYGDASALHYMR